jgi:hypothetical protein
MGIPTKMSKIEDSLENYNQEQRKLVQERIEELSSKSLIVSWGYIYGDSHTDCTVECRHGKTLVLSTERTKFITHREHIRGEDYYTTRAAYTYIELNTEAMNTKIAENQEECFVCGGLDFEEPSTWSVLGER